MVAFLPQNSRRQCWGALAGLFIDLCCNHGPDAQGIETNRLERSNPHPSFVAIMAPRLTGLKPSPWGTLAITAWSCSHGLDAQGIERACGTYEGAPRMVQSWSRR